MNQHLAMHVITTSCLLGGLVTSVALGVSTPSGRRARWTAIGCYALIRLLGAVLS
jgi:hypothetical protein